MNVVHVNLEVNEENTNGLAVTVYTEQPATTDDFRELVRSDRWEDLTASPLSVDAEDQFFEALERPNPVSKRAGLHRYQLHPTC